MNLKSRISRLEEKTIDKQSWSRLVRVVSHEHYPEGKLDAFLRGNGIDRNDPAILLINRRIVEPGRGSKEMCEPRIVNYA